MALLSTDSHLPQHGRGTVVTRHPATIRRVAQALGAVGIGVNHALTPAQMPKAAPGELKVAVLDLDVDPDAEPLALVRQVAEQYPAIPIVVTAGVHAKKRLLSTLASPVVHHVVPKLGGWLDLPQEQRSFDGPDEAHPHGTATWRKHTIIQNRKHFKGCSICSVSGRSW